MMLNSINKISLNKVLERCGAENDVQEEQDCYLIIHILKTNLLTLNAL